MIIKYNDFLYIFYSGFRGNVNYTDLDELWKLFCKGKIWYDFEKFVTIPAWHRWLDKRIYPTGRGNEDSAHTTLKALIKNYLDKKKIEYYGPEVAFQGGYPDVLTKDEDALYLHYFRRGKGFWKYIEEKQKQLREAHNPALCRTITLFWGKIK